MNAESLLRNLRGARLALLAWGMAATGLAGGPNYDAFSDRDGNIATEQHHQAAIALVRDRERLEAVYADAVGGNTRARKVWSELEASFEGAGLEVAERSTRPGCLVPAYRELSRSCLPDWSFLDFLAKDRPGGAQLRKVIFTAFAARAHERGLENQAILSAITGLIGTGVAAAALREAEVAAGAGGAVRGVPPAPGVASGRGGTKLKPDPAAEGPHTTFKRDPPTGKVTSHAEWDAHGNPVKRTDVTGGSHGSVTTPHTHEYGPPNVDPVSGKSYPGNQTKVRPARPDELPK
jgi:putative RNase toxin 24 of polymorphic toxin system